MGGSILLNICLGIDSVPILLFRCVMNTVYSAVSAHLVGHRGSSLGELAWDQLISFTHILMYYI